MKKKIFIIYTLIIFSCSRNDAYNKNQYKIRQNTSGRPPISPFGIAKKIYSTIKDRTKLKTKLSIKDYDLVVKTKKIKFNDLPKNFKNYKIALFSELNILFLDTKILQKIVKKINKLKPDLILFGGNLIKSDTTELSDNKIKELKKLNTKVVGVLGANDYDDDEGSKKQIENIYKKLGWILLDNKYFDIKKGGSKIRVIGIELLGKCNSMENFGDIDTALTTNYDNQNSDNSSPRFKILLTNKPDIWAYLKNNQKTIQLTLAGYTMGQSLNLDVNDDDIPKKLSISEAKKFVKKNTFRKIPKTTDKDVTQIKAQPGICYNPYFVGLYQDNQDSELKLYVTSGVGYDGICKKVKGKKICPVFIKRGGVNPQIALLTLSK